MNKYLLKASDILLIILITGFGMLYQKSLAQSPDSAVIRKPHFEFSIIPVVLNRVHIIDSGAKYLKSRPTLSGEADIRYVVYLKKNWALKFGTGASVLTYNYHFNYPYKFPGHPAESIDFSTTEYFLTEFHLTASLGKTVHLKKRLFLVGNLGIRINKYQDWSDGFAIGNMETGLEIMSMDNNTQPRNFLISYFGDIGLMYQTKKRADQFSALLYFNYCPQNFANGTFNFYYPSDPQPSYGSLKYGMNSMGIELTAGINQINIKKKSVSDLNIENKTKGTYIGFQTSVFNDFYKYTDSGDKIKSTSMINFSWGIPIRQDIDKNFSIEFGYKKKNYFEGYGLKNLRAAFTGSIRYSISSLQFPICLIYRLNIYHNQIFLVPVIGYHFCINNVGIGKDYESDSWYGKNVDSFRLNYSASYLVKTFSLFKTGLGLEFRLFSNTYFNFSCNYYSGLKSVVFMDIQYNVNNEPAMTAKGYSKGSYMEFNAAIYYKISSLWKTNK